MSNDAKPTHVLAHLSDTHFLAEGAPLYGTVDTVEHLNRAMARLDSSGIPFDALIHTGDIADLGELDAYRRVRSAIEPIATRNGWPIVWISGNHDARGPLREALFDEANSQAAIDSVTEVNGLRIIGLDTSVPGQGHGYVDSERLDWLRSELSEPAPFGTVLALHHPPLPTEVTLLNAFQLQNPDEVAAAIAGADVRAILAGHLHYSVTSLLAGAPVSVVPATSYTVRLGARGGGFIGVDGGQAVGILTVYEDRVSHSVVPIDEFPIAVQLAEDFFTG
jgi:Icc protein